MDPRLRLERFERALDDLVEANEAAPIIVEGIRDEAALRKLGATGEILVHNRGLGVLSLADKLRGQPRIIILYDWDRKGGQLAQLLRQQLGGVVRLDEEIRRELAHVSLVKCVEDLPAALANLRRRAHERSHEDDDVT